MEINWNDRLDEARERAHRQSTLDRRTATLRERIALLERTIGKLEVELDLEREDVERLQRLSWSNVFHTLNFGKKEQLELERQQAAAAALKLNQAKAEAGKARAELAEVLAEAADVHGAELVYERLLLEREEWIAESGTAEAERLGGLTDRIGGLQSLATELREAISAGKRVEHALTDAINALEKAENWGTFDLIGGGMISTAIKHGNIDDAEGHIANAGHLMHDFQRELKDVRATTSDLSVNVGGLASFADYFFDGLIADWFVQKRIEASMDRIGEQRHKIRGATAALQERLQSAERELTGAEGEKRELIERMP